VQRKFLLLLKFTNFTLFFQIGFQFGAKNTWKSKSNVPFLGKDFASGFWHGSWRRRIQTEKIASSELLSLKFFKKTSLFFIQFLLFRQRQ
jgi:hypothetical protein